jgi:hypothetical protein
MKDNQKGSNPSRFASCNINMFPCWCRLFLSKVVNKTCCGISIGEWRCIEQWLELEDVMRVRKCVGAF